VAKSGINSSYDGYIAIEIPTTTTTTTKLTTTTTRPTTTTTKLTTTTACPTTTTTTTTTTDKENTVEMGYLTFTVYSDHAEVSKCDESAKGEIIILSEINDIPVTSIENYAFLNCYNLNSINIPSNIENIGISAFLGCSNLKDINISEGVKTIGSEAFYLCRSLEKVNLPESITSIGNSAFIYCSNLTSINIPSKVETIYSSTFSDCKNLKTIKIAEGVKNFEYNIFNNCKSLTSIILPKSIESIGNYTFINCYNLTSIIIKNPKCKIYDNKSTMSSFNGTIYGYENSTAQAYAEKYGYNFAVIKDDNTSDETVAGDANEDGKVTLADCVAVLQYVANSEKYPLSEQGLANSDVYNKGDGVTGMDALTIQRYDSGIITSLPESVK